MGREEQEEKEKKADIYKSICYKRKMGAQGKERKKQDQEQERARDIEKISSSSSLMLMLL